MNEKIKLKTSKLTLYMKLNQINKNGEFSTSTIRGKYYRLPKYKTVIKSRYIFSLKKYLKLYLRFINLFCNV